MDKESNSISTAIFGEQPGVENPPGELQLEVIAGGNRIKSQADFWRAVRRELRATGRIDKIIKAGQDVVAISPLSLKPRVLVGVGLALLAGSTVAGTAIVIYKNHNRHKQEKLIPLIDKPLTKV